MYSSSSDSGDDSDSVGEFDDFFAKNGLIHPFRFEPICSDSECGNEREENSSAKSDSVDDFGWCSCTKCDANLKIKEEICCRNPKVLEDVIHICLYNGN